MRTASSSLPTLSDVTTAEWDALAGRRIVFGHQSVGGNILEGVREIMATEPHIRLNIAGPDAAPAAGGALVEALIGENGNPQLKSDDFARLVEGGLPGEQGVVMHKYCYVDMNADSDPQRIFEDYRTRIEALRQRHPQLTIVHITMPLTEAESTPKRLIKRVLGKTSTVAVNAARNRYNRLLLDEYAGRDPVFDLAALQSTRPDGSRSEFRHAGATVYTLASEWTSDGGHLNAAGRRHVAEQFLVFLAKLPQAAAIAPTAQLSTQ